MARCLSNRSRGQPRLHADRADGGDPDHRDPRRHRAARVPQPAHEGAGLERQDRRPQRAHDARDVPHRPPDLQHRRRDARGHGAGAPRRDATSTVTGTDRRSRVSVDSKATNGGGTFSIELDAAGDVTRDCTNPGKGGCRQNRGRRRATSGSARSLACRPMDRPWDGRRLHFVGIGGAGMSGLALVAKELGASVTGLGPLRRLVLRRAAARGRDRADRGPRRGERARGRRGRLLDRGRAGEPRARRRGSASCTAPTCSPS